MEPDLYNINQNKIGSLAIISLVFAVLSFIICPLVGGIIAIICSSVEIKSIKNGVSSESGRIMALIAFWLGIANIAISLLAAIIIILGLVYLPEILNWFRCINSNNGEINVIYRQLVYSFTIVSNI